MDTVSERASSRQRIPKFWIPKLNSTKHQFIWFHVYVRLGSGLSILISWLNIIFLSPPNLIPQGRTRGKKRIVVSNSTTSPNSCLDGRNEDQLLPKKYCSQAFNYPTSQISGQQTFFHRSLFYPSPFHCPLWSLIPCGIGLNLRPNIMCCLDIWWNWEGFKWSNGKFTSLVCSHR